MLRGWICKEKCVNTQKGESRHTHSFDETDLHGIQGELNWIDDLNSYTKFSYHLVNGFGFVFHQSKRLVVTATCVLTAIVMDTHKVWVGII